MYKVTLDIKGNVYKGEGDSAFEALSQMDCNYTHVKAKGTFTLTDGKRKAERFLHMRPLRMVMANKTRKAGLAKQLESLLK